MMELSAPRHDPVTSTTPETQCTQNFGGGKVSVTEKDGHYVVSFERVANQQRFKATRLSNGLRKVERLEPKKLELKVALRLSKNDAQQIGLDPTGTETILSSLKSKIGRGHLFRCDGYAGKAFSEILGSAEIIEFKNAKVKSTDARDYTFASARAENAWIAGKRRNGTFSGVVRKREVLDSASLSLRPDLEHTSAPDVAKASSSKPVDSASQLMDEPHSAMGVAHQAKPRGFFGRFVATAAVITCAVLAFLRPSEKRPAPTAFDGHSLGDSVPSAQLSEGGSLAWHDTLTLPSGDTFRLTEVGPESLGAKAISAKGPAINHPKAETPLESAAFGRSPEESEATAANTPSDEPPSHLHSDPSHDGSGRAPVTHKHALDENYDHAHDHAQSASPAEDEDPRHMDGHEHPHALGGHSHDGIVAEVDTEHQSLAFGYQIVGKETIEQQIDFSSSTPIEFGGMATNLAVARSMQGDGLKGSFSSSGATRLEGRLELFRPSDHLHDHHEDAGESEGSLPGVVADSERHDEALRYKPSFFLGVANGAPHSTPQIRAGLAYQDAGLGLYASGRQEMPELKIPLSVQAGGLAHQYYGEIELGAEVTPFPILGLSSSYRARSSWAGRNYPSFEVFHLAANLNRGPFAAGLSLESLRGDHGPETFDSLTEPFPHHDERGVVFRPEASWRFSRGFTLGGATELRSGELPAYRIDCEIDTGPCVLTLSGGHDQQRFVRTGIRLR